MAKKKNYYVVWIGRTTGIFHRWEDCCQQVKGFTGAIYAGFPTLQMAQRALTSDPTLFIGNSGPPKSELTQDQLPKEVILPSLCVDAACSGNPGAMEYRGVITDTGSLVFKQGPYRLATNNIGEFLAIVHALAWLKRNNLDWPVYSDSRNAILWVKNMEPKTKLTQTDQNRDIFELTRRAVTWLKTHEYQTKVLKWDTQRWGEIPADFGRK